MSKLPSKLEEQFNELDPECDQMITFQNKINIKEIYIQKEKTETGTLLKLVLLDEDNKKYTAVSVEPKTGAGTYITFDTINE